MAWWCPPLSTFPGPSLRALPEPLGRTQPGLTPLLRVSSSVVSPHFRNDNPGLRERAQLVSDGVRVWPASVHPEASWRARHWAAFATVIAAFILLAALSRGIRPHHPDELELQRGRAISQAKELRSRFWGYNSKPRAVGSKPVLCSMFQHPTCCFVLFSLVLFCFCSRTLLDKVLLQPRELKPIDYLKPY